MAKRASSARRTNRVLLALTVLAIGGAGAVAAVGNGPTSSPSSTTVPVSGSPANIPGARPAETQLSWFDHGFAVEQFDYEMKELSCEVVEKSITPDLCAVVGTGENAFMMVATEDFWDPQEADEEGAVWVPLSITMFTMRTDNKLSRAVSVLDGLVEKQYSSNRAQIDAYTAKISGLDVLVLHKHLSAKNADPYDLFDELQIIAMSPTKAPTVVGTYRGPQISVQATATSLEISSLRYLPTSDEPNAKWYTRISLTPSSNPFQLNEVVTSGGAPVQNGTMLTKVGTYTFPVSRETSSATPSA